MSRRPKSLLVAAGVFASAFFLGSATPAQAGVLTCTDRFTDDLDLTNYLDHCTLDTLGICIIYFDPTNPARGGVVVQTTEFAGCVS